MRHLTVRLPDEEAAELDAAARRAGQSRTDVVRAALRAHLGLNDPTADHGDQLEAHERRLSRLEELAGL